VVGSIQLGLGNPTTLTSSKKHHPLNSDEFSDRADDDDDNDKLSSFADDELSDDVVKIVFVSDEVWMTTPLMGGVLFCAGPCESMTLWRVDQWRTIVPPCNGSG
jgi:hypothetical protein